MNTTQMTNQLNGLLNQNLGGYSNQPYGGVGYGDSIPDELQEPSPLWEINYKSEKKQAIKKAKDSIMIVVKEVVPDELQNSPLIKDKINQDAERLGTLYYELIKAELVSQSIMHAIQHGESSAKLFDSYQRLMKSMEEINLNITTLQNQFRKYYIDTYLDMMNKDEKNEAMMSSGRSSITNAEPIAITVGSSETNGNVFMGTSDLCDFVAEQKKKQLMQKYLEEKNKETES